MSNAPQTLPDQSKTVQAGNDIKKDEERMKNEGGNSSTPAKPSERDTKPSRI